MISCRRSQEYFKFTVDRNDTRNKWGKCPTRTTLDGHFLYFMVDFPL